MILEHFIFRLIFCFISGLLFIAAFNRLAISHPTSTVQQSNKKVRWLGWLFSILATFQLIAFVIWYTKVYFPGETIEPLIPLDGIIRSSSTHIIWGYANSIQRFCYTFFIGTFACIGFAIYFFKFKSSPSKWWSKILKALWYVIIWMLYVNSTDFHYFDFWEIIKTILYTIALIICFNRSTSPRTLKPTQESVPPLPTTAIVERQNADDVEESTHEIDSSTDEHIDSNTDGIYTNSTSGKTNDNTFLYCRFCGNKIEYDSKFCKYCGKQLDSHEMGFSNRVFAFMDFLRKKIVNFFNNFHNKVSKAKSKSRKHDIRKIFKYIGISFVSFLILVGIGFGIWYYFDVILPQNRANENYTLELSSLNSLSDDELFEKCEDIIRNHNISKCGKEYLDENNLRELTDIAWNKINLLAENGNADAQFMLGLRFGGYNFMLGDWYHRCYNGKYMNPDINFNKSAYWYLKAAEQGHATAQNNIGRYYDIGIGVSENKREALRWYRLSAQNNDALGLLNLGDSFRDGLKEQDGTQWIKDPDCYYCKWQHKCERHTYPTYATILQCDIDSAKYYWHKSAELGNQEAKDRLHQIY